MIKVRDKYIKNPVVGQLPGSRKFVGIGGDVVFEHAPRPAITYKEATKKEYKLFFDAGLYPAAIYKDTKVKTEKEENESEGLEND